MKYYIKKTFKVFQWISKKCRVAKEMNTNVYQVLYIPSVVLVDRSGVAVVEHVLTGSRRKK
jgi:hypothetical protein